MNRCCCCCLLMSFSLFLHDGWDFPGIPRPGPALFFATLQISNGQCRHLLTKGGNDEFLVPGRIRALSRTATATLPLAPVGQRDPAPGFRGAAPSRPHNSQETPQPSTTHPHVTSAEAERPSSEPRGHGSPPRGTWARVLLGQTVTLHSAF